VAVPQAEQMVEVVIPTKGFPHGHFAVSKSSNVLYPALNYSFLSFLGGSIELKISNPQSTV